MRRYLLKESFAEIESESPNIVQEEYSSICPDDIIKHLLIDYQLKSNTSDSSMNTLLELINLKIMNVETRGNTGYFVTLSAKNRIKKILENPLLRKEIKFFDESNFDSESCV